jgi:hypothetical protein
MAAPCALFISDLHLQPAHPATRQRFRLPEAACAARAALYLLGDLFEYWAGDDDIADPYHAGIVAALRAVSDAGVALYWIAGNRDFLVGARFAEAANVILLPETWVAEIGGARGGAARRRPVHPGHQIHGISRHGAAARVAGAVPPCRWRSARPSSPACAKTAAGAGQQILRHHGRDAEAIAAVFARPAPTS